jgi:hypothetical protein
MRNWKILLIIASLSLSVSQTSCGKKGAFETGDSAAPTASAPAASAPPSTAASKPVDTKGDAMKSKHGKHYVIKLHKHLNSVNKILESLDWGNIAFNSPEEMNVGETTTIKLILSGNQSVQKIEATLKKDLGVEDEILGAKVKIAELMKADLNASELDFKIEPLSDKEQAVSTTESTEWIWKVTPKKAGKKDIHLRLSAIIKISDSTLPHTVKTFDKYINVKVTAAKMLSIFISDNWQWLWTTILIPLAPFIWNVYQKRKEKMPPENSPSGDLLG